MPEHVGIREKERSTQDRNRPERLKRAERKRDGKTTNLLQVQPRTNRPPNGEKRRKNRTGAHPEPVQTPARTEKESQKTLPVPDPKPFDPSPFEEKAGKEVIAAYRQESAKIA